MSKKRRTFGAQFRVETILEGIGGEKSIAQICRERGITETMYLYRVGMVWPRSGGDPGRLHAGWALSRSLSQQLTLDALDPALHQPVPLIFHADQGWQYAAWLHTERWLQVGVQISMSHTASPTHNGIVERFMRTVKEAQVVPGL